MEEKNINKDEVEIMKFLDEEGSVVEFEAVARIYLEKRISAISTLR